MTSNLTNTLSKNVMSTTTNSDGKKVRHKIGCCIFHQILLMIIFLFITTVTCYDCTKHRSKQKRTGALTIVRVNFSMA